MSKNLDFDLLISLAVIGKNEEERNSRWNEASEYVKSLTKDEYENLLSSCSNEEKVIAKKLKERCC